jgi:hypothetical protein
VTGCHYADIFDVAYVSDTSDHTGDLVVSVRAWYSNVAGLDRNWSNATNNLNKGVERTSETSRILYISQIILTTVFLYLTSRIILRQNEEKYFKTTTFLLLKFPPPPDQTAKFFEMCLG